MSGMKDQLGDTPFEERRYPDRPGYVHESKTSRDAARKTDSSAGAMRTAVLDFISAQPSGATCDEVEAALDMRHQTASARVRDLVLAEKIMDTGKTRKTRSGSSARVYVALAGVIDHG